LAFAELPSTVTATLTYGETSLNTKDFAVTWEYTGDGVITATPVESTYGYEVSLTAKITVLEHASQTFYVAEKGAPSYSGSANADLEAAGYGVSGTWTYERNDTNINNPWYLGFKGTLSTFTIVLDRPATVTLSVGGNAKGTVTFNGNTIKSGEIAVVIVKYELEAGTYEVASTVKSQNQFFRYINIDYGDSTEFIASTNADDVETGAILPTTAAEKEGYAFVGWVNGDGVLYAPGASVLAVEKSLYAEDYYMGTKYSAVYARINTQTLGIGFRTDDNPAVRYGFAVDFVKADDSEVLFTTSKNIGNITGTFYTATSAGVKHEFTVEHIGYTEAEIAGGETYKGIATVFTLTQLAEKYLDITLCVNVELKINGATLSTSLTVEDFKTFREYIAASGLSAEEAAKYGYVA
jgi:hypothetical protein